MTWTKYNGKLVGAIVAVAFVLTMGVSWGDGAESPSGACSVVDSSMGGER